MKKVISILLLLAMVLSLAACGSSKTETTTTKKETTTKAKVEMTADTSLTALKKEVPTITKTVIYTEDTDPNGVLGRPNQYIGKGDFFDSRMEDTDTEAGTIEFFSTKSDCKDRYDYLGQMSTADLGSFGLNQYIYKYDKAIFRVSYEFTTDEAAAFKTAMDTIMDETSTQYKAE